MNEPAAIAYITTFYSFKGGVGRTTLLVNVAHALAARGERVVIWDLDLEAPGVHHFPGLEPTEKPWQGGFLEWLGDNPLGEGAEPAVDWPPSSSMRALTDRVYAAPMRGSGKIFVLPAHGTNADIGRIHAAIDWAALFVQRPWHGVHLFKRVCQALSARFEPTFILADSRTGVTDLGGLLTGFLPDCTVLVGNYGAQSTHGLRSVYVALDHFANPKKQDELRRDHRLERLVVASPVPTSPVARERGRARWRDGFPGVAPRSLVEVPLVENLLYAEDVLVRTSPSSDAARAYTEVAIQLAGLRDARRQIAGQQKALGRRMTDPGNEGTLAVRAARLLGLLGFEVAVTEPTADVDFLAVDQRPLGGAGLVVKCKAGTARADARWQTLFDQVRVRGAALGYGAMIIAEQVGVEARGAAAITGVALRTVGELEDQLVDLRPYRDALRRDFENSGLARGYVEQRFVGAGARGGRDAIESTLAWLHEPGPRLMLVVGDGGSGKSSFLRRLAYELVTRSSDEPELPTPLLIDLLDVAGASSLEGVLQEHLRRASNWHGNPESILYLLEVGRVVLLFDGFDELSSTSSEIGAEEQLRVLSRPVQQEGATLAANRVIISCRKHFVESEDGGTRAVSALAERLGAAVHELAPFEFDQIEQFLRNRLGAKAGAALGNLRQNQRAELSQTPLYLDLLAQNGEMLVTDPDEMSVTRLFERTADGWLASPLHGSTLKPVQRQVLIERLAAELWRLSDHELSLSIFAERLMSSRTPFRALGVDQLDRELRSAPFLVRSPAGTYRFSQRAFLEYFLAEHLVRAADNGLDELRVALATERLSTTCAALFAERLLQHDPDVRRAQIGFVRDLSTGSSAADVIDNATRLLGALGGSR